MTFDIIPIDPLVDEDLATQWIEVHKRSGEADWGDDHCAWALAEIQGRRRGTGYSFVDLAAVQGDAVIGMDAVGLDRRPGAGEPRLGAQRRTPDRAGRGLRG